MSENNNIEFTFDYNEAETVDRLISLEDTLDMLEQLHHRKFIANKRTSDIAFVNDVIRELKQTLLEHAENNGYDTTRWIDHSIRLMREAHESPLHEEFWQAFATELTTFPQIESE